MTFPETVSPMTAASNSYPENTMRGATRMLNDILADLSAKARAGGADQETMEEPRARLGDIIDRLDERAFGFLLLLLALPCCLPFVYILPQIVALPMLALTGQLAAGRHHPWLPKKLHDRPFSVPAFQKVIARSEKYVRWVERFAKPRLRPVTSHLGARFVGALLLIPTASILVPLPSTNTVPGIGVAIASLGLIERDGFLVGLGLFIGLAWVVLLLLLGFEAANFIKEWMAARL